MLGFVSVALKVCEDMHIVDKRGQGMIMRFAKLYSPEKMGEILRTAMLYPWWEKNPVAAFMKAVGQVNKNEKNNIV